MPSGPGQGPPAAPPTTALPRVGGQAELPRRGLPGAALHQRSRCRAGHSWQGEERRCQRPCQYRKPGQMGRLHAGRAKRAAPGGEGQPQTGQSRGAGAPHPPQAQAPGGRALSLSSASDHDQGRPAARQSQRAIHKDPGCQQREGGRQTRDRAIQGRCFIFKFLRKCYKQWKLKRKKTFKISN